MTDPSKTHIVVVSDSRLPADRFIFDGIEVSEPVFTVSEVAKFFFARSSHWIRWRERQGHFTLDGVDVGGHRTEGGARRYTLSDIEKMSHALAQARVINGSQLTNTLLLLQAEGRLYGYLI